MQYLHPRKKVFHFLEYSPVSLIGFQVCACISKGETNTRIASKISKQSSPFLALDFEASLHRFLHCLSAHVVQGWHEFPLQNCVDVQALSLLQKLESPEES